jgi:hypothetical protein
MSKVYAIPPGTESKKGMIRLILPSYALSANRSYPFGASNLSPIAKSHSFTQSEARECQMSFQSRDCAAIAIA